MVKLTKEEKQVIAEFGKIGRRLDRKKRWTAKMVDFVLPIYDNPHFNDYLTKYDEIHASLMDYSKLLLPSIQSQKEHLEYLRQNILEYEKKEEKSKRDVMQFENWKDNIPRTQKNIQKRMDQVEYYEKSTLLPPQKDISLMKKLEPRMYAEMLKAFSDSFQKAYLTRKKKEFLKNTPIYNTYIRPKLEEVLESWRAKLKTSVFDAMLRQVTHFASYLEVGGLVDRYNVYLEYIHHKSKYYDYNREKILSLGEIKEDKIIKYAHAVVDNNINSFIEKMALKLQWLDEKPLQFSLNDEDGSLEGMLCADFTLIYADKQMMISTTYETAISSKGNPFIRFPTRFYYDGTMKSVQWMSENFFKKTVKFNLQK